MKKILSLVMAVLMLTTALAGCGNKTEDVAEGYVVLEETLVDEEFGIGFRDGDVLCEQVNAALKVLKANGTVAKISESWFGGDITIIEADETALDGMTDITPRTFILGLDDSFPPMGYRDDENNIVGFDINLAQAVCDLLGWTLELQPISWDAKEMELQSGNIDCIWNGMTLTEKRMETMSCSDPYLSNEQVVVVMASSGYDSLNDLSGKKVALQTDSSAEEALNSEEHAGLKESLSEVVAYGNYMQCFMDLEQGGVDAVIVDSVVADWYINTNS